MDENEIDADELISESGDPRGHVYEKANASDAEPRVDWWSLEEQLTETRIEELEAGKRPTKEEAKLLWEAHMRHCFKEPDDDIMPGLWFCKCPAGVDLPPLIVVLCYGYRRKHVDEDSAEYKLITRQMAGIRREGFLAARILEEYGYWSSDY